MSNLMRNMPNMGFTLSRLALLLAVTWAAPISAAEIVGTPARPCVVLAPDDSGDFGPKTPGTRTSGWQEALDHCVAHHKDLYIQGGWGGRDAIYHVQETIRIPASQDFRIDGGVYVLNWTGPAQNDLLVIDSGMDCHYRFGILVYGGKGAALRIKPENPVPIDKVAVFIDSDIITSSIADPRPFERGKRDAGAGVVFDTSKAPILHADFSSTSILNFATCVVMPDEGQPLAYTRFHCGHLHTNADQSTLLRVGRQTKQNHIHLRIGVDQGAGEVTGVDLSGSNNRILLNTRGGFFEKRTLVFRPASTGNRVEVMGGAGSPLDLLADESTEATNRIALSGGPPPIRSLKVSSGTFTYTQRLFPAAVRLAGTAETKLTLRRGAQMVNHRIEESMLLDVGDQLIVDSAEPSTLTVIPQGIGW